MARISEPAFPSGRIRGGAAPAKTGGQRMPGGMGAPAPEPAFKQTPGRSTNKLVVPVERKAFATRGGKGNGS